MRGLPGAAWSRFEFGLAPAQSVRVLTVALACAAVYVAITAVRSLPG
ncbi:hypothetical protein [Micromonospora inositola]|nr:hypothetical protein [Micromonospora inositola]